MSRVALAFVLLLLPLLASAELCLVVGVSDGDTLTARCGPPGSYGQVRVRLAGIDAPEKAQPFGQRAKQALSDLAYDRWADLQCTKTDRYDRRVCSVMVAPASAPAGPKTLDVGLALVADGMAWWYRAYAHEQTAMQRAQYDRAEQDARARRANLWRDADALPPWTWRAERRPLP